MNPQNGEVISMANYPSFDPNNPGEVYEIEKIAPTKYANPYVSLL
jgi:cell division protein FtsI/penicillin-binding protein 2